MNNILEKCNRKLRNLFILSQRDKWWYVYLYPSFWHSRMHKTKSDKKGEVYLAAGLNSGAGIGHQLGFWFEGYLLAQEWKLPFAHEDFFINGKHKEDDDIKIVFQMGKIKVFNTSRCWNKLLRIDRDEVSVESLLKQHYRKRRLPAFDPTNEKEMARIRTIIASYQDKKIILRLENDQSSNCGLKYIPIFREKFWGNRECDKDCLLYNRDEFNIAIHIRRGDVDQATDNGIRYNDNSYYLAALQTAFSLISDEQYRNRKIYVFSEGVESDFSEFSEMDRIRLCIGRSAKEAFLHFAYADLTIVSKSGFSCFGAMLNNGKKLYQKGMYFPVPDDSFWIPLDEKGQLWKQDYYEKHEGEERF